MVGIQFIYMPYFRSSRWWRKASQGNMYASNSIQCSFAGGNEITEVESAQNSIYFVKDFYEVQRRLVVKLWLSKPLYINKKLNNHWPRSLAFRMMILTLRILVAICKIDRLLGRELVHLLPKREMVLQCVCLFWRSHWLNIAIYRRIKLLTFRCFINMRISLFGAADRHCQRRKPVSLGEG